MMAQRTMWILILSFCAKALGDVLVQPGYRQPLRQPPTQPPTLVPYIHASAPGQRWVEAKEQNPTYGRSYAAPYHLEVHPIYGPPVGIPDPYARSLYHRPHITRLGGFTHVGPSLFVGNPREPLAVHHRYRRSAGADAGGETPDEDGVATEPSLNTQTSTVADLQKEIEPTEDQSERRLETRESKFQRHVGHPKLMDPKLRRTEDPYVQGYPDYPQSRQPQRPQLPAYGLAQDLDYNRRRPLRPVSDPRRTQPRNFPDPRPINQPNNNYAYPPRYRTSPSQDLVGSPRTDYNGGDDIVGTKFGKRKLHPLKHPHHHHHAPMKTKPVDCGCQPPPIYVVFKSEDPCVTPAPEIQEPPCMEPIYEEPELPCPVPSPPPCPVPSPPPCPVPSPPPCAVPCTVPEPPPAPPCPEPPSYPTPEPYAVDYPQKYVIVSPPCTNCPQNCNYAPSYTITATAT